MTEIELQQLAHQIPKLTIGQIHGKISVIQRSYDAQSPYSRNHATTLQGLEMLQNALVNTQGENHESI